MPLVRLQTSATIDDGQRSELLAQLSATTAKILSKPEAYVMVVIEPTGGMLMGGTDAPAALLEVRSVGAISPDTARTLSKELSDVLNQRLGIEVGRVFGNFDGVAGAMWGYNGSTLG